MLIPQLPGMPLTLRSRVLATDDQVSTTVGDEVVILGLHDGVYYGLDAVGVRLWTLLKEPRLVSDLVDVIMAERDVDALRCEQDVLVFLEDLVGRGLAREVADAPHVGPDA